MNPAAPAPHPNADPPDEALLAAYLSGDSAAFDRLVRRYQGKVYGLALRLTGERFDAEEVLQDVFLTIARKGHKFRGEARLSSWIYRVTVNAANMKLRKRRRDPRPSEAATAPVFAEAGHIGQPVSAWFDRPDAQVLRGEAMQQIELAIQRLPEEQRSVVVLRDVQGLSGTETADILGISVPAMKTRLHRARLALREHLSEYFRRSLVTQETP